jgi:DNA-binding transcriptional regulator YiaG
VHIEKLRKQMGDTKNVYLTLDKAEEFDKRLQAVTEDKNKLEEDYFTMRTKYRSNQLQMDDAVSKAEHFQELLEVLQKSKQSELSDRLITLSEKMQTLRLSEMRANRELNEVKEKNEYFARLLRTSTASLKKLEE